MNNFLKNLGVRPRNWACGVGSVGGMKKNEIGGQRSEVGGQPGESGMAAARGTEAGGIPDWWGDVPAAEKAVIRGILGSARGLKQSRLWPVAQAARKWESGIACFIKSRLMGERRRTGLPGAQVGARPTASPTCGRSQPGVSPTQG